MMKNLFRHINWKIVFQKSFLIFVLFLYLIVPFKQQFIDSAHLVSHIANYENPYHSHDHSHDHSISASDHHHGYLAFLNQALSSSEENHAVPDEINNFQFQKQIPSAVIQYSEQFPIIIKKILKNLFIPILLGPSFDVPTPPP